MTKLVKICNEQSIRLRQVSNNEYKGIKVKVRSGHNGGLILSFIHMIDPMAAFSITLSQGAPSICGDNRQLIRQIGQEGMRYNERKTF